MNEQNEQVLIASSYELLKTLASTRKKLAETEERLERLEKMEMMLRLWIKDLHASDNGSAFFTDDRFRLFRIGYQEAQMIAFRILCDNDCEATRKYKEMLNAPE